MEQSTIAAANASTQHTGQHQCCEIRAKYTHRGMRRSDAAALGSRRGHWGGRSIGQGRRRGFRRDRRGGGLGQGRRRPRRRARAAEERVLRRSGFATSRIREHRRSIAGDVDRKEAECASRRRRLGAAVVVIGGKAEAQRTGIGRGRHREFIGRRFALIADDEHDERGTRRPLLRRPRASARADTLKSPRWPSDEATARSRP